MPYLETIRAEARAHGRYKKQTGGRGQFGDCHIVIEPIEGHVGYEFVDKIVGGVIPQSFRPAVDKGIQEAMAHGELAGAPVQGVRVRARRRLVPQRRLVGDGVQDRRLDGVQGRLREGRSRRCSSRSWSSRSTVPDEAVGAVNGDLNSRRGRLLGHGAEERHDHDQGRGADGRDAHVLAVAHLDDRRPRRLPHAFLRYEEVPTHIAQKLIEEAKKEKEAVPA